MLIPIEYGTLINPDKVCGAYISYEKEKERYKLSIMFERDTMYCFYKTYDEANDDLEYLMECANAGHLKD